MLIEKCFVCVNYLLSLRLKKNEWEKRVICKYEIQCVSDIE